MNIRPIAYELNGLTMAENVYTLAEYTPNKK